jgi:hypothetical protein
MPRERSSACSFAFRATLSPWAAPAFFRRKLAYLPPVLCCCNQITRGRRARGQKGWAEISRLISYTSSALRSIITNPAQTRDQTTHPSLLLRHVCYNKRVITINIMRALRHNRWSITRHIILLPLFCCRAETCLRSAIIKKIIYIESLFDLASQATGEWEKGSAKIQLVDCVEKWWAGECSMWCHAQEKIRCTPQTSFA